MTFRFGDGRFRFYVAQYGSWQNDARVVFRVRVDSEPHKRAAEKGIKYFDRLLPAKLADIKLWCDTHPDFPLKAL
jgi:hypothetical protein